MKGSFKISEQIDNYGFFGSVELTCSITESARGSFKVIIPDRYEEWSSGITFGATYFKEHVIKTINLIIEINNMEYHAVDTSNTIIAYDTFNAILAATQFPVRKVIEFDRANKSFIFPK